ncbi:MAG TPA: hypothetical protein VGQ12_03045 [Candidatus Angelobacter sp.]|nr:hypothetical protein [Candidatus Angelobacter sp.]
MGSVCSAPYKPVAAHFHEVAVISATSREAARSIAGDSWHAGTLGKRAGAWGVTICFQCKDALAIYREFIARGVEAKRPFVGNGLWVTSVQDPDGYRLEFASPTDVPEETVFSDVRG